nr:hypothetical protein [Tanacetum cinerariifolium]GEY52363.1 hypothetical protein [Tanacetum cinerariifolium]
MRLVLKTVLLSSTKTTTFHGRLVSSDSCEIAKEIRECVRQMMKGLDIGEHEKKAKLFNEWEKFTSTDGESVESYYHRFMQLMNYHKRNKHFPENIAANLKIDKVKILEEMVGINLDIQNLGVQNGGNQNRLVVVPGIANQNGTGNIVAARAEARLRRRDAAYLHTQLLIAQKEKAGIQLQAEEFDFMATTCDLDEIEEVNANCILMENLQHASTSEQYTDLLEPIPEPQLVPQNDNHVTSVTQVWCKVRVQ